MKRFFLIYSLVAICILNISSVFSEEHNLLNKEVRNLKPGVIHYIYDYIGEKGKTKINVLEVDLSNRNISVKVGLPDRKHLKSKEKLTEIVQNEKAFAAINANYFDVSVGNPLGVLISKGDWLVGPIFNRVAIGFTKHNEVFISQIKPNAIATLCKGAIKKKQYAMFNINGFNTPPHLYEGSGLFTDLFDEEFVVPEGKTALLIKRKSIKDVISGSSKVHINDYLLLTNKSKETELLENGDKVKISWDTIPEWGNIREAVSGGPYLIMDGQIYIDEKEERIRFSKNNFYAARSAIGVDSNNKLYLITVDANKNQCMPGLSLKELAKFLYDSGLKDAINLDGGGSSTLVIDGKMVNIPGSHNERKISNGLLIMYRD